MLKKGGISMKKLILAISFIFIFITGKQAMASEQTLSYETKEELVKLSKEQDSSIIKLSFEDRSNIIVTDSKITAIFLNSQNKSVVVNIPKSKLSSEVLSELRIPIIENNTEKIGWFETVKQMWYENPLITANMFLLIFSSILLLIYAISMPKPYL